MTTLKLIALAALGAAFFGQGISSYTYSGGHIIVRNYSELDGDGFNPRSTSGSNERHSLITGNSATIEAPEKGVTIKGSAIDFRWAQLDPKTVEFRSALIKGHAELDLDADAGYQNSLKFAAERKLPAPKPLDGSRVSQLISEEIQYSGNVSRGTIQLPVPWTYHQNDKGVAVKTDNGKTIHVQFDQTFDCSGQSGQIVLVKGKTGDLNQVETGFIQGPVHFKLVRIEIPDDTKIPSTTTYVGVADRIDINMLTQPGTVTASGHVKVNEEADGNSSSVSDEKIVLTVTPDLEPISVKIGAGSTTVKTKDGSH